MILAEYNIFFDVDNNKNIELLFQVSPSTTKAIEDFTEETVPDTIVTTTLSPPRPPDDIPKVEQKVDEKNTSVVKNEETTTEGALPLIPLIAISGLVTIVAVVMFFIYKKNQSPKPSSKKEDMVRKHLGKLLVCLNINAVAVLILAY